MSATRPIVAFGELLLRLATPANDRFVQAETFEARYSGAEGNLAVLLAGLGWPTAIVSKVPTTDLGQACINYFRRYGVDTTKVVRGGERLGILFVEQGAGVRPTRVLYDRQGSSFVSSTRDDYDWGSILDGAGWFHFSGTALLGGTRVGRALADGLEEAKKRSISVSCDVNYRSKLWSPENAGSALVPLLPFVDVLLGSGDDAARVLGITLPDGDIDADGLILTGHLHLARQLAERFGINRTAGTRREDSPTGQEVIGILVDNGRIESSSGHIDTVVDRIGAGDAFSAGIVHGLLVGWAAERCVAFATAVCRLKHTIDGDFALTTAEEVDALLASGHTRRVER